MQSLKKKTLTERKIRISETLALELNEEAKEMLQIAIIAEEEERWEDALEAYKVIVQKNYEMGDNERARAFEEKITRIKLKLKSN